MLRRKAYDHLTEWKNRPHKCLLVKGQRQVGKTFIIDKFAKENYEHYVYIDLSREENMISVFNGNLDVDSIIKAIMLYRDPDDLIPGSTLIFMDEIQDCPRARASLKSFTQDGRYDVIASGSLLGIGRKRTKGDSEEHTLIPMGYEEHMTMHSLDFEEFLWARKIGDSVIEEIRGHIRNGIPLDRPVLDAVNSAFRDFMIVGGMPKAVSRFFAEKNYAGAGEELKDILASCIDDINKYNDGINILKTRDCFLSIPSQLSQTNKKFMFNRISGGGSRVAYETYAENLLWIENAGYGNFCRAVDRPAIPLRGQEIRKMFKVYLSDTGMLTHMYGPNALQAVFNDDPAFNKGALTENVIAECLVKAGYPLYYYRKSGGENMMEVDFVAELGSDLAAIEVKSGKDRTSPSLWKADKVFDIGRKIMFGKTNIVKEGDVECYPLFTAAFIDEIAGIQKPHQ
jgi:predicted AAA+ superfamily ATPase